MKIHGCRKRPIYYLPLKYEMEFNSGKELAEKYGISYGAFRNWSYRLRKEYEANKAIKLTDSEIEFVRSLWDDDWKTIKFTPLDANEYFRILEKARECVSYIVNYEKGISKNIRNGKFYEVETFIYGTGFNDDELLCKFVKYKEVEPQEDREATQEDFDKF